MGSKVKTFLATLSVMLITFFYMLFSDGTALDFINKIVDNFLEVSIFVALMIIMGWSFYFVIENIFGNMLKFRICKYKPQININNQDNNYANDEPLSFCNECKDKDLEKKSRYCQSVINLYRLVKETTKDENYKSIAVAGEWGSGKSSVLLGLKELLQIKYDSYIVVYINVWKYKETSQIISSLQDELNEKFPNENLFITQYLDVVASWYEKESFLQKILPKETQKEFENRIIKKLENKRLIIMIDEIDRIVDKSELMEVLKLIKVHSGIKKTTVITAISQKHFLQTMGEIDPKYLQKYFYYTFPIPSFSQQDFLKHNYQIFKAWESSSGDYLQIMRDEYFKKEMWKHLSNHREAKQLFSFLNEQLTKTLNSHTIVQEKEITKKYSIVFFYLALLHTTNLGLYLQLESIDENDDNEIIKLILEHVSINDLKQLFKEFKQRSISYGSHPWFLIHHYIDTNKYSSAFNNLHITPSLPNNHDREHYKLVLENINFEQLQKIKEYLPYFLNTSKWVYQAVERLKKHEEFKQVLIEGFTSYKGQERFKKLSKFIADIENNNLEKWKTINKDDFKDILHDTNSKDVYVVQVSKLILQESSNQYVKSGTQSYQVTVEQLNNILKAGE